MYYIYKNNVLKGKCISLEKAQLLAKKIKGLIYRDNQVWFDYR